MIARNPTDVIALSDDIRNRKCQTDVIPLRDDIRNCKYQTDDIALSDVIRKFLKGMTSVMEDLDKKVVVINKICYFCSLQYIDYVKKHTFTATGRT